jgi:Serine carboxypeptidase S28
MLDTNIQSMQAFYGGRNLSVRKVFFTSGALDPLRTLSVLEDLNEDTPAVVIPSE